MTSIFHSTTTAKQATPPHPSLPTTIEVFEALVNGIRVIRSRRIEIKHDIIPFKRFDIQNPTNGRGYYAIASQDIAQGERVLVEQPLFLLHTTVEREKAREDLQFAAMLAHISELHPDTMDHFRNLHSRIPGSDVSTWYTNATSLGNPDPNRSTTGIYLNYSRLNHSCTPNLMVPLTNVEANCSITLVAAKNIKMGEEVTLSYISQNEWPPSMSRKVELYDWGFECDCPICQSPGKEESDRRREQIRSLKSRLIKWLEGDMEVNRHVWGLMKRFHELVEFELCGRVFDVDGGVVTSYVDQRVVDAYEITRRVRMRSACPEDQRIGLAIEDRLKRIESLINYYKTPEPRLQVNNIPTGRPDMHL